MEALKRLTLYDKQYIDENYKYEPITRMANVLKVYYMDIDVYCKMMGYMPADIVRAKPKKTAKCNTFDVDTYKTWTI